MDAKAHPASTLEASQHQPLAEDVIQAYEKHLRGLHGQVDKLQAQLQSQAQQQVLLEVRLRVGLCNNIP